jgi:alkyl hydroperoxide reductase subunit F
MIRKSPRRRRKLRKSKMKKSNKIRNLSQYKDGGSQPKIEIYSKNGCPYCNLAKQFLFAYNPKIIEYNTLSEEKKEIVQNRIKKQRGSEYSTYPIIFINDKFIGGYSDLVENFSDMNPTFVKKSNKEWSLF